MSAHPCATAVEREAYDRRTGMLLCLAYVLGSSDLHGGNVVGCGQFPTLVDLEVMMSAGARVAGPDGDSVLRTGLLPGPHIGRDGQYYRGGALIAARPRRARRRWRHVNSDRMASDLLETEATPSSTDDQIRDPVNREQTTFASDVAAGFRDMFIMLRRHHPRLVAPDGPLALARRQRYRVILRSTAVYAALLNRACHPVHLRDGAEWSIELEQLKKGATRSRFRPALWPALDAERVALERLDIPVFEADPSDTALHTLERATVPRFFAETPYGGMLRRLTRLQDDELTAQTQLIRVALTAAGATERAGDRQVSGEGDRCVSAALDIFRRLRSAAFESRAGELNWIGATRARGRSRREVSALGWDLFGGRAGVALFFAAVAAVTNDDDASAMARRILEPLVEATDGDRRRERHLGAAGVGGMLYALVRVGTLLRSHDMLDRARRIALGITPDAIERSHRPDMIFGVAGLLVALLPLYEMTSDRRILERAHACGRRLLAEAPDEWTRPGLAHGAAGIVYSLARLHRVTGDTRYRRAVVRSWRAYDASLHAHASRSRASEATQRAYMLRRSWCRGASGLGLSRLACATFAETPDLLPAIDRFVEHTVADDTPASDVDHACCGHVGRICFLAVAARRLNRPDWMACASVAVDRMIDRVSRRTMYKLGVADDLLAPGFFQGLAGIGYELLRIRSDSLPAVLLFE